jgi:biopolymer transport protein ExbD
MALAEGKTKVPTYLENVGLVVVVLVLLVLLVVLAPVAKGKCKNDWLVRNIQYGTVCEVEP